MFLSKLYKILDYPFVYNMVNTILSPRDRAFHRNYLEKYVKQTKGLLLDVGCGPVQTPYPPEGTTMGIDINPKYIKSYSQRSKQEGCVASADQLPFKSGSYEESRCIGLLHHLSDEQALATIEEMVRCTKHQGKIVVIDNTWPQNPWIRPLAWLLRKLDRGQWVRSQDDLSALIKKAYPGPWQLERYTYTLVGHEALLFFLIKE